MILEAFEEISDFEIVSRLATQLTAKYGRSFEARNLLLLGDEPMSATAFALFGGGKDRTIDKWKLNTALYDVAKRAVSDNRSQRQQSIEQLIDEWRTAKT